MKRYVIEIGKILLEKDFIVGSSGSISSRVEENLMIITPGNMPFYSMKTSDLLVIDTSGNIIEGENEPSPEAAIHIAIYNARRDVNAIILAQPIYATAFAVAKKPIPMILNEVTLTTKGDIEVAEYASLRTIDLANNVISALKDKNAVLLAKYGIVSCGGDLEEALDILLRVERTAKIYILSRLVKGTS